MIYSLFVKLLKNKYESRLRETIANGDSCHDFSKYMFKELRKISVSLIRLSLKLCFLQDSVNQFIVNDSERFKQENSLKLLDKINSQLNIILVELENLIKLNS